MFDLPRPPEPVDPSVWLPARRPQPGELTASWRVVLGLAWAGIVVAFAAVWKSARTLGLSTWWLGPSSAPNLLLVQVLPFVVPVAMVIGTIRNLRHLPYAGIAAAGAVAVVAAFDIGRVAGLAAVEFALAGAGLLVSVAAFAGMLRAVPAPAPEHAPHAAPVP